MARRYFTAEDIVGCDERARRAYLRVCLQAQSRKYERSLKSVINTLESLRDGRLEQSLVQRQLKYSQRLEELEAKLRDLELDGGVKYGV